MKTNSDIAYLIINTEYLMKESDACKDINQICFRASKRKDSKLEDSFSKVPSNDEYLTKKQFKEWDKYLLKKHGTLDFQILDSKTFDIDKDDLSNTKKIDKVCKELKYINDNIKAGQIIIVLVTDYLLYYEDAHLVNLRKDLIGGSLSKVFQTSYYETLWHYEKRSFKMDPSSKSLLIFNKKDKDISLINVMGESIDAEMFYSGNIHFQTKDWNRDRFKEANFCLLPSMCFLDDVARTYNLTLSDIAEIKQGSNLTRIVGGIPTYDYDLDCDGEIFYPVKAKYFNNLEISNNILPVCAKKGVKIELYKLHKDDIVLNIKSNFIKAAIVSDKESRKLVASSNCLIIRTKPGYSPDLVLGYLNSDCFKIYVNTNSIDKYQKVMTVPFLKQAPIPASMKDFNLNKNNRLANNIKMHRNQIFKLKEEKKKAVNNYESDVEQAFNKNFKKILN